LFLFNHREIDGLPVGRIKPKHIVVAYASHKLPHLKSLGRWFLLTQRPQLTQQQSRINRKAFVYDEQHHVDNQTAGCHIIIISAQADLARNQVW
jgi:hypothetical protein